MTSAHQRLTIAHFDTERGWSGGQVQVFLLMDGLAARGHHNVLLCPPGSRQADVARERGHAVCEVAMRNDLDVAAVVRLRRALREVRPDMAHLHTGRANWLGGLAARWAGVPAITTRRMDGPVRRHLVNRIVYGKLVRRAIAISPAVERLLADGGVPAALCGTIPSTVDPFTLEPTRPRAEVRAELGAAADDVVLLGVARLTHRKGFDVLLQALVELKARGAGGLFWLAGDGPERLALQRQVEASGLDARCRLLGRRDDVPDLLGAADVFVMPSRAEGLGIAALEAMAAGLPVVASHVGGLGEAVVHDRTGRLVPPGDVAELADALEALVLDGELRRRLGAAGPQRIREGFHHDQMVEAYVRLYEEILGR